MSKEFDARLSHLDMCLEHAVVEAQEAGDAGVTYYDVFVPGVVREHNTVIAESPEEAKEKVRAVLVSKLEHYETKAKPVGPDTQLEVQNGSVGSKADHVESGNSNG